MNYAGIAVGLWAFLYPRPYELLMVLCAIFPLAGVIILVQSNGLVRFDERKGSAHPAIIRMFMMPSLALALRSLDFSFVDAKLLLLPIAAITAVLAGLILAKTKEFADKPWSRLLPIIFVAVYACGLTVMGNCLFDQSQPEVFTVQVIGRHVSSGRSTSYHVMLAPWGPVAEAKDVTVPRAQYKQIAVGQEVHVAKKAGILRIPWFYIALE